MLAGTLALSPSNAGADGGPQIGGLAPVTYDEGGDPVAVAEGITISDGGTFADGFIEFNVVDATSEDRLFLPEGSTPDATEGAITVIGDAVHLGLGGGQHKQIGTVNSPNDGQGGRPLRIDFSAALTNSDFSGGVDSNGHPIGWTVNESQIAMGALASKTRQRPVSISGSNPGPFTVAGSGYSFQTDKNYTPSTKAAWGFEGEERTITGSFDSAVLAHGGRAEALRLHFMYGNCPNNTGTSYCSAFGPDAWSSTFEAKAGDDLAFDWSAANGDDDYEVYGFLVDEDSGDHHELMYGRGELQDWTTSTGTIPADGTYRFRFVSGTYDATGGLVVGASLYIDNVRVLSSDATDAVAESVARLVHYENTGKNPKPEIEIEVIAEVPGGTTGPETIETEVTLVDDAPEVDALAAIEIENTPAVDTFPTRNGTVDATDPEGDPITFSVTGAVADAVTIDATSYTHSLTGTYGTLHVDSGTGAYAFVPDAGSIDARATPDSESFTVVATANGLSTTAVLTVDVSILTTVPGPVTGPVLTAGDSTFVLSWTAPTWLGGSAIEDHLIEISDDGGTTWSTLVASTGSAATSHEISGLTPGDHLTFRISAINAVGAGHPSDPVGATVLTVPGAPTITSVTAGNRTLTVAFAAPGDDGGSAIAAYEYSVDGGVTWKPRRSGTVASPMVIGPLENATTYPVRIRAVNLIGAGAASNEVAATPKAAPVLPANPATPPAPTGEGVQLVDGVERPITRGAPSPLTGELDTPAGTLRFADGDFQVDLLGLDAEGQPLELDAQGRLVIVAGAFAAVSGEGFQPGSTVDVWLMSTPIHLGDVLVGADGTFAARLPIPDGVEPGPHTIQLNGIAHDGTVRTLSVGVVVRAAAQPTDGGAGGGRADGPAAAPVEGTRPAGLAFTGVHAATVSLVGVLLLLVGSALIGTQRRRSGVAQAPAK